MSATLELALQLLGRGLSVIPVPRPRSGVPTGQPGDGKVPIIAWREFQDRPATPAELERPEWFGGIPMNIAIVTGAISGIVVVDIDDKTALRLWTRNRPETPWQVQTGSGGWHLYYAHPGVRVPNRVRIETPAGKLAIDVRGDGGYVIGPGSLHACGDRYEWAGDWTQPRRALPRFWPGWIERKATPAPPSRRRGPQAEQDVVERARRYLAAIPRPEIGHGSDRATFYAACRLLRKFALSASDAEALLWEWCGDRPGWTQGWVAQKVAHASKYGTEPIGALR
jgi:hypothetical protein